jgi:predicted lipoprotein with Yx(FWY)xxD motif/glucose/arabinose dehydrogenase
MNKTDEGVYRSILITRLLPLFFLILLLLLNINTAAQESPTTVSAAITNNGIPTLVGPDGRTLYTFSHDDDGESTCYDQCAEAWPPLTIEAGSQPTANAGVPGQLGTVEREDGSTQVTYDGWPLYYFVQDTAPGEAQGQGARSVWFAANPATVMLREQPGVGNMLVGAGGLTLYVFLKDEIEDGEGESYCFEECEVAWPPVVVDEGVEPTVGDSVPGELGIHEREDGSRQVTYNGWPLYYFKMDSQPGDITGNGMKDVWYVAMAEEAYAEDESMSVSTELVAEGLTAPIALVSAKDDTGRLFVADQAGTIRILSADGQLMGEPFLDITNKLVELMPEYDERGLLGVAFHPDYANNGRFFVYYTAPLRAEAPADWSHTNVVSEFSVSAGNPDVADVSSERIVWMIDQPQFNHDAGQIVFGPDGYLYIPIGDGGGGNDVGPGHTPGIGNAQDLTNQHGSILRIDVDSGDPYGIPADNPFAAVDDNIADEIYAYGLRNPFHISFDSSGQLYVGDAGQELYEEVSIVTAGGNYGWNIMEGTHCFDPANPTVPPADCSNTDANGDVLINPVIEYDHTKGVVVVGGYVVEGGSLSNLNGYYIFGSYTLTFTPPDGRIFAAQVGDTNLLWDFTELEITNGEEGRLGAYLLSFGMDDNGELYVLTSENMAPTGNTGKVWRLAAGDSDTMEEADTASTDTESIDTETSSDTGEAGEVALSTAYTNSGIPTLVDANRLTLYTFAFDHDGESTCYGHCAEEWPPLLVGEGMQPTGDDGVVGQIGTVEREDGSQQVTYNGWPLYYYHDDTVAGDDAGQGLDDVWFAANPADIMLNSSGQYVVGPGGLTLYIFTEDAPDESYCFDECLVAWPPLVVPPGTQPTVAPGVAGEVGTTELPDGQLLVTYNGWPLYFFKGDMNPGDANGDGVRDVWFVAGLNRPGEGLTTAPEATPAEATVEATTEGAEEATAEVPTETAPEATAEVTAEIIATQEPTLEPTLEPTPESTSTPVS